MSEDNIKLILEVSTVIGTIGAVIVALFANFFANKNTKRQIRVEKLESLYEAIQSLTRYYGKFKKLYIVILDLRDPNNKSITTLDEYYKIKDQTLSETDTTNIINYLSKVEILTNCYIKGSLKEELLKYQDLMYAFSDLVFNGGSIYQEIKWKNAFPDYDKFYLLTEELKKRIIKEIGFSK